MNSFHWLRAFLILVATCAAVVLFSTSATADEPGPDRKHQMPSYSELDANGDGGVTDEEFYAFRAKRMAARAEAGGKMRNAHNAPSFEDLDLNSDGNLSAEEFAEHQAQRQMARQGKADDGE